VFAVLAGIAGHAFGQPIALPEVDTDGEVSLEQAIYRRQSVRDYAAQALTVAELGQLLWAARGVTVDGISGPTRAAASAGGLYPVEAYAAVRRVDGIDAGVYYYDARNHELDRVHRGNVQRELFRAALGQAPVRDAPVVVVLGADYSVTEQRYGERGVERYVHMDAGHAAQNVLLQAAALGLGATPIGAFRGDRVKATLDIPTEPLYIIPVGRPR
jgi:SagB-type dehydrogenase family enzyme